MERRKLKPLNDQKNFQMKKAILFINLLMLMIFSLQAQIAVKADKVYTVAGEPINNGVVLIKNGKIEKVGTAESIKIPSDYKTYEAKIATPGLVDARSEVGLS